METTINCPIDRGFQFTHVCTADEDFVAGEMLLLGANLLCIVVERGEGATVRAATIAAGNMAQPPVVTCLMVCEDVTLDKLAGDDTIAIGSWLWYSVDDDCLVTALNKVDNSGACYKCAVAIELSDDPNDTVRVHFDGRFTVSEAGTA